MGRRTGRRSGIAVMMTAASMAVVSTALGLAIDGSVLFLAKGRLSAAVDASVLAGARSLSRGMNLEAQRTAAAAVTRSFFDANFPPGFMGTSNTRFTATIAESGYRTRTVTVTAKVDVGTYFLRVFRIDSATVGASAMSSRRDVNVMVVLDRSSSLQTAGACGTMKSAARAFVQKFAAGRDRVGLLTFGGSYRVDFQMNTNFKTASPTMDTLIGQIACTGNTGTAQALWQAYRQLADLGETGALNLIVFFTDGLPNGVTADYNALLKPASTCTYKTAAYPKIGFIAQWAGGAATGTTAGVVNHLATSISNANETAAANSQGCSYGPSGSTANLNRMRNDVARMPTVDYYGNATTGYKAVDLTRVDLPPQIIAASINAADDAASRIRQDTALKVVVYTIGLGGTSSEPADHDLMRRISNDPQSPIFDESKPAGFYVYSPTSTQLSEAFSRVASEILRLAE